MAALPHIVERLPTVQAVEGGAVVVVGVCDRDGLARAEPWAKLTWDDVRSLSSPHTPFAPDIESCPAPRAMPHGADACVHTALRDVDDAGRVGAHPADHAVKAADAADKKNRAPFQGTGSQHPGST